MNLPEIARREFDIFLTSLLNFTRIPLPEFVGYYYRPEYLPLAVRYLPLVGILVGGLAGLIFVAADYLLLPHLAVLLSMVGSIVLTGAFHEDGWADVCDGFGGGMTKARILEIMKDSRLGTYGTLGLIMMLALKAGALVSLITSGSLLVILIVGHALSRFSAITLMFYLNYVRLDASSKAKPLSTRISSRSLGTAALFGLLPVLLLPWSQWFVVLSAGLATVVMGYRFKRRIGGYTGDCLGAVQQVSELVIYLSLIAINRI